MIDRYSRQILFSPIGAAGQKKLGQSKVVVIGCGALGTVISTGLVRAGVGDVRVIDRDLVELHNLQRQILFDEDDAREGLPKAIAAERHLRKINSSIQIKGIIADVNYANIENLIEGAHLIVDGLDNLETRLLINDAAHKHNIPWIYGGAISASGMTMTVIPGETPCFRCFWSGSAIGGSIQTCDTAGVIGPAPFIIGALQTVEALKILTGNAEINRDLLVADVWRGDFSRLRVKRRAECPACRGEYEYLSAKFGIRTVSLCGQNSVQVQNPEAGAVSLPKLAERLRQVGKVSYNDFMLRFYVDGREMVLFPDGRAIIKDTEDEALAKGMYAKYIGN